MLEKWRNVGKGPKATSKPPVAQRAGGIKLLGYEYRHGTSKLAKAIV